MKDCIMIRWLQRMIILTGLLVLVGCAQTTETPPTQGLPTAAHTPTPTSLPPIEDAPTATVKPSSATCADVDRYWANDWPAVISVLEQLRSRGESCGPQPLASKQYAAHIIYGRTLEDGGDPSGAVEQYRLALALDGTRDEAYEALTRLDALPPPTPAPCPPTAPLPPLAEENADASVFLQAEGDTLIRDGQPFTIRGVNYYSRFAQWHRFLKGFNEDAVTKELDAIREAGFNTIRIFLWYEPLFTCAPEDAVPVPEMFARLDRLLQLADARGLGVIMTLNDLPDLIYRPLYTDYARYDAQTAYIVTRYQNDPTILMWDVRNEGDLDYGVRGDEPLFPQETVMGWLAHASQIVHDNAPNHLVTAGWWGDPTITTPYVDVLSFHHWFSAEELAARIDAYRIANDKPLILQEVGYHSWAEAPQNAATPQQQAQALGAALQVAEERNLAGWLVWTAFDYIPYDAQYNFEHFFGLWDVALNPKPALEAVPLGDEAE